MKYFVFLLPILFLSCLSNKGSEASASTNDAMEAKESEYPAALDSLTEAHQLDKFNQKQVIAFDIELHFNNKLRLKGSIFSRTNSSRVLVAKANGTQLLFDGQEVFINPDTAGTKGARFDALTWSYFALAPFKFKDAGTHIAKNGLLPLYSNENNYATLKLTFGPQVGDAPDDWYILFQEKDSELLKAMAYIVTFGDTPQEEAAKNPHAIVYSDYVQLEGVPFASRWTFHNWNANDGLGSQLGEAKLSNFRFMNEPDSLFKKRNNSKLVPLK